MNKFIVVNLDGNIHCLRKKDIEKLLKINASVIEIKNEKILFNIFKKADAIILVLSYLVWNNFCKYLKIKEIKEDGTLGSEKWYN